MRMKKSKKKWIIGGSVVLILFLLIGIGSGSDGENDNTGQTGKNEETMENSQQESENEELVEGHGEEEPEPGEEIAAVTDDIMDAVSFESDDYEKYLHYGSTYSSTDESFEITVIDTSCRANEINGLISKNIFVVFDVVNNGTSDLYLDQDDAVLFIDDYEVNKGAGAQVASDNGYVMAPGNVPYDTSVTVRAGGRKGTIAFTCTINSDMITETSNIEFEILGLSYKINPLYILNLRTDDFDIRDTAVEDLDDPFVGTELEGMVPDQGKVGTYASDDGNTVIILDWRGFSVMFSDGYDCEFISFRDIGTAKYLEYEFDIGDETCSVMFFGDSMLVEGPIGGWYELIGDERYYSDEERGME